MMLVRSIGIDANTFKLGTSGNVLKTDYLKSYSCLVVVCRLSSIERVTCPEDFYCCGVDQCCKLAFEEEDEDSSKESLNNWVTALCVRTVIVTGFMVLLLIIGKSIQYCRKRYFGKFCSNESSLPRYLPLEKNSIATDIGSISALMGTPFYPVNTEHVGFRGGVPMVVY